jgi:cytochrome c553
MADAARWQSAVGEPTMSATSPLGPRFVSAKPRIKRRSTLLVAALVVGAPLVLHGQTLTPLAPLGLPGDANAGATLAYTCTGCHGIPGYRNAYPSYQVPKLGGQNAAYLEIALQGYRRGTRHHQTMQAQAASLSDQDIADLAAYFASFDGKPATGISDAGRQAIEAGRQKSVACAPCHGGAGQAEGPQWPNLAGQHASYLQQALTQYRHGGRADLFMGPMIGPLDDEDFAELAAYFAALPGLYSTVP